MPAMADNYEWYWWGDLLPRDYSEYCNEPQIGQECNTLCTGKGYTFPNNQGGEVPGGAYCKELVTHYKLWCSCDTSSPKYPDCPPHAAGACYPDFYISPGVASACSNPEICGGGTATCNFEGQWTGNVCMLSGEPNCVCLNTGQG